jgi:hypothetical protein
MATIENLVINPSSGALNATVKLSASANTGRNSKTKTITVKTTNGSPAVSKTVNVTQSGINEFISCDSYAQAADNSGASLSLTGTSNAVGLNIFTSDWVYTGTPDSFSDNPAEDAQVTFGTLTANGTTVTNGVAITGDPGATAQYVWKQAVTVPANPYSYSRSCTVTIRCSEADNVKQTITISQTAAAPTLTVDSTSITIPAAGTAVSLGVTSNTAWSIS